MVKPATTPNARRKSPPPNLKSISRSKEPVESTTTPATVNHHHEPAEAEKYATPKEGAAFLGVPVNTFYKMCLARVVPSYKLGKLRRVRLSEVAAFAESHRIEAVKSR